MAEQKKVDEQVAEQPQKKRTHKGAIIAWSIIGGVVLATGGGILALLGYSMSNSPTAKVQGKTFNVDMSENTIQVFNGGFTVDAQTRKNVLSYINTKSSSDSEAKVMQENISKYGADVYKQKFADTKVTVSSTNLFKYSQVTVSLLGSSGDEIYHYSLQANSENNDLKTYLVGDEREQMTKLYTATGILGNLSLYNTRKASGPDVLAPYASFGYAIGTVLLEGVTYSVQFRVNFFENK